MARLRQSGRLTDSVQLRRSGISLESSRARSGASSAAVPSYRDENRESRIRLLRAARPVMLS